MRRRSGDRSRLFLAWVWLFAGLAFLCRLLAPAFDSAYCKPGSSCYKHGRWPLGDCIPLFISAGSYWQRMAYPEEHVAFPDARSGFRSNPLVYEALCQGINFFR